MAATGIGGNDWPVVSSVFPVCFESDWYYESRVDSGFQRARRVYRRVDDVAECLCGDKKRRAESQQPAEGGVDQKSELVTRANTTL
jgi:hypothetical protein